MTYLSHIQAELERLSRQLDCKHLFVGQEGYKLCLTCGFKYDVCTSCEFPTYENECDWCDNKTNIKETNK